MVRPALSINGLGFFKTASAEGAYWQSPDLAQKLHAFLREFTPEAGFKQANVGGDQESGFEQAFSSLAFAYLKDKSPRLLDYIIGFQLVDRNEDNTKAIGIFGFKVGKTWLYAPVFFLNGDLKGQELLYIKNQDTFVPNAENWVNYILARRPHTLGEGSDRDVFQLGGLSPNFSRMAGGAGGRGKYSLDANYRFASTMDEAREILRTERNGHGIIKDASGQRIQGCRCAGDDHLIVTVDPTKCAADAATPGRIGGRDVDAWARDFYPLFAAAATKQANFLYRELKTGPQLDLDKIASAPLTPAFVGDAAVPDLTEFISLHPSLLKHAHQLYKTYPGIKAAFDRFYGGEEYFLKTAQAMAVKFADDVFEPRAAKTSRAFSAIAAKTASLAYKVRCYGSSHEAVKSAAVLTDGEKTRLMTDGYLIADRRGAAEKTAAYDVTVKNVFTNATETGLCEVLVKPGNVQKMVVLVNPYSEKGPTSLTCSFKPSGGRKFVLSLPTQLYVAVAALRSDWTDWHEKLSDGGKPSAGGGYYVFVGRNGQATLPFRVSEKYSDNRYRVMFSDRVDSLTEQEAKRRLPHNVRNGPTTTTGYGVLMTVGDRGGSRIQTVEGQIHIPKDEFKLVKVESNWDDNEDAQVGLASPLDLQAILTEKTARLKIWSDGVEVSMLSKLGSEVLSPRAALFALVQKHGLDEQTAKDLLKEAGRSSDAVSVGLKYAAGYPFLAGGGPDAPALPPPEVGTEQVGYGGVPAQYQQEEHIDVPGSDASTTDPSVYDPFLTPDRGAIGIAEEAGQSGQKEVFDASMISGMLKSVTQDSMIDRYLGPLMKALDKLGRLIFMMYWHSEEFQDRFGKAEMPNLEDALRNTFEGLGDTLLTLKEKTIDAGLDEIGDPDISSVARN